MSLWCYITQSKRRSQMLNNVFQLELWYSFSQVNVVTFFANTDQRLRYVMPLIFGSVLSKHSITPIVVEKMSSDISCLYILIQDSHIFRHIFQSQKDHSAGSGKNKTNGQQSQVVDTRSKKCSCQKEVSAVFSHYSS